MKTVFLLAFFAISAVHLYASYKQDKKLRSNTKGFILLALLGWYCCSVEHVNMLVVTALWTSWLGDVLLIPQGKKWFTLGGISFMASHICFVLIYNANVNFAAVPLAAIILAAIVYAAAVCLVFRGLKAHLPKILFYPMFLYLLINGTMNCFAFFQLLSVPCLATVITFVGAVLFFASDSMLFYVRFVKDSRIKSHFPVMITYIFAEFLIVLGIVMLG